MIEPTQALRRVLCVMLLAAALVMQAGSGAPTRATLRPAEPLFPEIGFVRRPKNMRVLLPGEAAPPGKRCLRVLSSEPMPTSPGAEPYVLHMGDLPANRWD